MNSGRLQLYWLLLLAMVQMVSAQSIPVDGYAAIVNDRVITVGDVMAMLQPVEERLRASYEGRELEQKLTEAFESARETLIERALILEDFQASEAELPDRVVDDHINTIIRERFDNNRAIFLEALAEQRMTLEEWRQEVKEQLILVVSRRQNVSMRISVSPREIRELYEERNDEYSLPAQVDLRMIVINKGTTEEENEVKRQEAEQIVQHIRDGADFATLARESSEGSHASDGGDWGWIKPDSLRSELMSAIRALDPGEVSEVIEAGEAYYILKLDGRREASMTPLAKVKDQLEEALRQEKEADLYNAWIQRLRDKYYIKIF